MDIIWRFEGDGENLDLMCVKAQPLHLIQFQECVHVLGEETMGEGCLHHRPSEDLNQGSPDSEIYIVFIIQHYEKEPGIVFLWRQCWFAIADEYVYPQHVKFQLWHLNIPEVFGIINKND